MMKQPLVLSSTSSFLALSLLFCLLIFPKEVKCEQQQQQEEDEENSMIFDKKDFYVNKTLLGEVEPAFGGYNDGDMYAGLLPIDVIDDAKQDEDKDNIRGELMFWLFTSKHDSITIWLNGGPGCTSFSAGLLFEISPVTSPHFPAGYPKTTKSEPLGLNEWAWTKSTDLLFVEQPVGTGFSYGNYMPQNETDLSQDFYNFLINFYNTFPELKSKRLFIVGESYAGMYVPSIAHQIHLENNELYDDGNQKDGDDSDGDSHKFNINLSGIGIGNGWMDAQNQGSAAIEYAYWHGMIDSTARLALLEKWDDCIAGKKPMLEPFHNFTIPDECGIEGVVLEIAGAGIFNDKSPNTYDVTTWDRYPILNDPHNTIREFFNNPKVKKALNVPDNDDTYWLGCIPGAGRRRNRKRRNLVEQQQQQEEEEEELPGQILLKHDLPESTVPYVAELLDAGIRVMVYNGDRDLSVNAQGSERLLDSMVWDGSEGWKTTKRYLWMVNNNDTVAGYVKSYANLDFVIVYNSGHLVPNNVPVQALDLITRFVQNESFQDIELPYFEPRNRSSSSTTTSLECPTTNMVEVEEEQNNSLFIVFVAIVCFICGFLASWLFFVKGGGGGGRKGGYTRISGGDERDEELETNGNDNGGYQLQQSSSSKRNNDYL